MGGNYEKGIYNQLMEVMARLDSMEDSLRNEKREHKEDVDRLNKKIDSLTEENRLLKDDNARLRSIINNDSSNTSQPPSTDQKGGKPANTFNGNFPIPVQRRSDVTYGENVKALAVCLYSEGVMSNDRIAAFLNAAGNGELDLSEGSVYGFCRKFAGASEESIRRLEENFAPLLHPHYRDFLTTMGSADFT